MRFTAEVGTLCINGHAAAGSKSTDLLITQAPTRDTWKTYGTTVVTKSLCASQCTMISSRKCSHNILCRKSTAGKLNACTYLSARTGCLPKVKPVLVRKTGKNGFQTCLLHSTPTAAGCVATKLRRCSTSTRCSVLLPNRWLLAAGVCLGEWTNCRAFLGPSFPAPQQRLLGMQVQAAMPQEMTLKWRDETYKQQLNCGEGSVGANPPLICCVLGLEPALLLNWRYTEEQRLHYKPWRCTAVWLHHAHQPNGTVPSAALVLDLQAAINKMASSKETLAKTLLVNPLGMSYDHTRLGGNH